MEYGIGVAAARLIIITCTWIKCLLGLDVCCCTSCQDCTRNDLRSLGKGWRACPQTDPLAGILHNVMYVMYFNNTYIVQAVAAGPIKIASYGPGPII